jgi:S-adenosylmethionine:tRNA ribosyltransferase-isomerase
VEVPDYDLPFGSIAQQPVEPRDAARLLVALRPGGGPEHRTVADLPDLLDPGDLLVVNTSRVLPARLRLTRPTGGAAEVLLLEPDPDPGDSGPNGNGAGTWLALIRPGRRLRPGAVLVHGAQPVVEVGEPVAEGRRRVRLLTEGVPVDRLLARIGEVPLPPYIEGRLSDPERYQTVYADRPGSVAAPTAGLHLSTDVIERLQARGIETAAVDLAVGLGTFRPITASNAEDHVMHAEWYELNAGTMRRCRAARRVVAVGTTTVRALESAAATGRLSGQTSLYIHGEFRFQIVDVLMTNFHQPRSSLLVLLEAFYGPGWRDLYQTAQANGYRFLSFGDAMLVARGAGRGETTNWN